MSYLVGKKSDLDEALAALMSIKELKHLELIVRNFVLTADELRVIGGCVCVCWHFGVQAAKR